MIVGKLLERCARAMRKTLGKQTPAAYFNATVRSRSPRYEPPPGLVWDDERYAGDAYGSFAWACNVVEIEWIPTRWR